MKGGKDSRGVGSSQNGYGPPAFSVAFTVGLTKSFTCVQTDVRRLSFRHARSYTLACPGKCVHIERLFLQLRSLFAMIVFFPNATNECRFHDFQSENPSSYPQARCVTTNLWTPRKNTFVKKMLASAAESKIRSSKRRDIFWCWRSAWAQ